MPPLVGLVGKILDPVVGLSSEAIAHHKAKKAHDASRSPAPASTSPPTSLSPVASPASASTGSGSLAPPPPYAADDPARRTSTEGAVEADPDIESDEEQWELDEAAKAVGRPYGSGSSKNASSIPKGNFAAPASVEALVESFVTHHPPSAPDLGKALTCPVILPQRRPKDHSRGFVRAYAPLLGECGIQQETWFEFLETFDESVKVSPIFDVINLAAGVAGFVPEPTAQIVTAAVSVADVIAKRTYGRFRNNSFLARINEVYFKPQGLCCLLVTYRPGAPSSPIATFDLQSTVAKAVSGPEGNWDKVRTRMAQGQGRSVGAAQVPEAAPLVYPQLDAAGEAEKRGAWKRSSAFVVDYFDRRAQAANYYKDPESALSSRPRFESGMADPGSGLYMSMKTDRGKQMMARRRFKRQQMQNRRPRGPIGLVKRALRQDICGNCWS